MNNATIYFIQVHVKGTARAADSFDELHLPLLKPVH
jgi:hypothetical protein